MRIEVTRTGRRKRNSSRPTPPEGTPCGYCFQTWATGYDHLIPWVYGGSKTKSNLYPCCRRCNSILGAKFFDSISEKREYVRQWLIKRGQWKFPLSGTELQEEVAENTQAPEVLLPKVPMGGVAPTQDRRSVDRPVVYRSSDALNWDRMIQKQVDAVSTADKELIKYLYPDEEAIKFLIEGISSACISTIVRTRRITCTKCGVTFDTSDGHATKYCCQCRVSSSARAIERARILERIVA